MKLKVLFFAPNPSAHSLQGKVSLEKILRNRFDLTLLEDEAGLQKTLGNNFAAVVLYVPGDKVADQTISLLAGFVENGGGLVGIHCGSNSSACLKLFGAQVGERSPAHDFEVRVSDAAHPVVARISNFRMFDELPFLQLQGEGRVFAVAHYQGKDHPMGWQRQLGKGNVVCLANGRDARALANPTFTRMVERATRLVAGENCERQIKVGIIGYGGAFNMGKYHAEAIHAQTGMKVTTVCDLDPKRTEQAKRELGDSIVTYNDMGAFLSKGDFELCIQILPHHVHAASCIQALEAGKHVVTEKPFCVSLAEADAMVAASKTSGRMLSCFHNRRWDGDFAAIHQLVRSGRIGEIYRIDAGTANYGEPGSWWRSSKKISGGTMFDWGAHYMDWTLMLMNKRVASVSGDFQKRKWHGSTNEDYTFAMVRFEDGTTATLEQGNLAAIQRQGWRILGTEGAISNAGPRGEITLVTYEQGRRLETTIAGGPMDAQPYYANIGNHLIMGEPLAVTPEQARRVIGVIWLAEQSSQQGGVPLPLPGERDFQPDFTASC